MSGANASPPATPLKKRSSPSIDNETEFDYYKSSNSVTDGDDSSIDGDASAPPTPAAHQFSPPGPQRRRSMTLAVMPNHMDSIHGHSIFKLGNVKSKTDVYEDIQIHGEDGNAIYMDGNQSLNAGCYTEKSDMGGGHQVTFSQAIKSVSPTEQRVLDVEAHDCTSNQSDALDLAKNGLPSACIFVANLASSQTDEQLLESVQNHFKKFGRLHVKIRRDAKGNPYSFCQFESDDIARTAVREGRHAIIDATGRRIRCEPAKVNRSLVLERRDSAIFDRDEVEKALFGYGRLEAVDFAADVNHQPTRGLDSGKRCFVRFVYRQDAVDCYQYVRCHAVWTADWIHNFHTVQLASVPRIHVEDVDPHSIFVGKLNPSKTTETLLRKRFDQYGAVSEVHLFSKHKSGVGRIAFAFIKYESERDVLKAIEGENNTEFLGNVIHVQRREIHKKSGNSPYQLHEGYQRPGYYQPWSHTQLSNNPIGAPVMLNLRDVADLADKLSYQLDFKRNQAKHGRCPSNTSPDAPKGFNSGIHPTIASRETYANNPSISTEFRFRHPLQIPGVYGNHAFTSSNTDQPLSPRSANETLQKSAGYQMTNIGENSPSGDYEPTWQSIFPGYYNALPAQPVPGHVLHSYPIRGQIQYLHPGHLISGNHPDLSRRSSAASMSYNTRMGIQSANKSTQASHSSTSQQ